MSEDICCLISRVAKPVPWVNGELETNTLEFIMCSVGDHDRKIHVGEGWSPHNAGGLTNATRIVSGEMHTRIFLKDGCNRYEKETSTVWFDRNCDLLDCPWFPAMVRRMASGGSVLFTEIQEAYRTHNHGEDIPIGNWSQLYKAWEALKSRAGGA